MTREIETRNYLTEFEVITAQKMREQIIRDYERAEREGVDSIYKAYGRPSAVKAEIWDDWRKTFCEMWLECYKGENAPKIYINRNACFTFSIIAKIGKDYFYITRDHNRMVVGE